MVDDVLSLSATAYRAFGALMWYTEAPGSRSQTWMILSVQGV